MLKVLGSSSKGNCYLLESEEEILIIELGIPFKEILQAIDFRLDKVIGCLVSHEHKDHSKALEDAQMRGLTIYVPYLDDKTELTQLGRFTVAAFELYHNVPCYGFYIRHVDMGTLVFATDTAYLKHTFRGVNWWLIECNYSKAILDRNVEIGAVDPHLADRIVEDHMSFETCKKVFGVNDMSQVKGVVLLHLSNGNSDAEAFEYELGQLMDKEVYIAQKGLEMRLDLIPF